METEKDQCSVCGGTDTKLIDGYYYCVECGTQNTNVRETILEEKALADGTLGHRSRRKILLPDKDGIEMTGEWYHWHTFNYIIFGLANELTKFGAKPSFKVKLLWIWTRYIKKYQNKEALDMTKASQCDNNLTGLPSFLVEENKEDEQIQEDNIVRKKMKQIIKDIRFLSKGVITAMLYLALNLDENDIQLSHLYKFLQENRFDTWYLKRYIPEGINVKKIPQWHNFRNSSLCTANHVREIAMCLLKKLDLGTPKVPNLRKIVDNFLTELCLPNDIKPLIYSLMHYRNCDFLDIDESCKKILLRVPDYEGIVMAYVLIALKICFGLDCDYEVKLSEVVDKINVDDNLLRSYKIGKYSEPSDRLFSFREWCSYLQFRKCMLSKNCLRIVKNCSDIDDYVYYEHMAERPQQKEELSDKIAIDIISRLPQERNLGVIPKDLFVPTLTPMSDYTDIIIDYCQDSDIKLKLAEDFRRYSLKYVCENLDLLDSNTVNVVRGVSIDKKVENKIIFGMMTVKKAKKNMVYVKNCENRNWLKTNAPTIEHVVHADETVNDTNDKESDHGYDSEAISKEKDTEDNIDGNNDDHTVIDGNGEGCGTVVIDEPRQGVLQEYNDSLGTVTENYTIDDNSNSHNIAAVTDKSNKQTHEGSINELMQEDKNNLESALQETSTCNLTDKSLPHQNILEDDNTYKERESEITQANVQLETILNHDNCSVLSAAVEKDQNDGSEFSQNVTEQGGNAVSPVNNKDLDITTDTNLPDPLIENSDNHSKKNNEEKKREIIQEEDVDKNIFDDCFEDITLKEECDQNNADKLQMTEDIIDDVVEDNNHTPNNELADEDFDRRSDISDDLTPKFNPETFDRQRTIKELILHACKKYKIAIPTEYRTKEPPKRRREKVFGYDVSGTRPKKTKYEGEASVKNLLSNYYNYLESDFVTKVQRQMSIAVRNTVAQNEDVHQEDAVSVTNLEINVLERSSMPETGSQSPDHSETDNTDVPNNQDLNTTNMTGMNDETDMIDINLENTLFEDDEEMQLDDLIPRGDPNFDESVYETDQLYIKLKSEEVDISYELPDDPIIDNILATKIEQCKNSTEFAKLKGRRRYKPKAKEESDSEDDVPLSVFKEEKLLIEDMTRGREDNYEQLIKKQDIPEYNYWIRHYDNDFITRNIDLHKKFDEELKENTPSNFYFVLQECSSILNYTNFSLYRYMQCLEEYLVSKAKNIQSDTGDAQSNLMDICDNSVD